MAQLGQWHSGTVVQWDRVFLDEGMMSVMIDDRELERLAARLGEEAGRRVDPARTADAVVARLRAVEQPARRWWGDVRVFRAAAVIVAIVGSGIVVREALRSGVTRTEQIAQPVELVELATAELAEILDTLEFEAPVAEFTSGGLVGLSETELQELLATMEG